VCFNKYGLFIRIPHPAIPGQLPAIKGGEGPLLIVLSKGLAATPFCHELLNLPKYNNNNKYGHKEVNERWKLQEMIVEANLSLLELLQFFHLTPRRMFPSSVQDIAILIEGCVLIKD
jgi:hypothetical protein